MDHRFTYRRSLRQMFRNDSARLSKTINYILSLLLAEGIKTFSRNKSHSVVELRNPYLSELICNNNNCRRKKWVKYDDCDKLKKLARGAQVTPTQDVKEEWDDDDTEIE